MTPSPEQVVAEGRSLLRFIAIVDAVHEQDTHVRFRTYCDHVWERVQAIFDRNQRIVDERRRDLK